MWGVGFLAVVFGALLLGEYDQPVPARIVAIGGTLALAETGVLVAVEYFRFVGLRRFRRRLPLILAVLALHLCLWSLELLGQ